MSLTAAESYQLTPADLERWERDGLLIVRGLFSADDVAAVRDRFVNIDEARENVPGWNPDYESDDPLKRYPRVMHPHRWDKLSMDMMLHPNVDSVLQLLLGESAVACQAMYYHKPPGSPGQSLHQDNFYLAVQPGTCIGVWVAIDPANAENGGLYVVPGSDKMGLQCPDPEDFERTKRTNLAEPPPGMKAVPTELQPGDALIFNGGVVHGSGRNRSETMWRRSFICHYMARSSTHVNKGYFPIYDFEGNEISFEGSQAGGPCGYKNGAPKFYNTYGVDAELH